MARSPRATRTYGWCVLDFLDGTEIVAGVVEEATVAERAFLQVTVPSSAESEPDVVRLYSPDVVRSLTLVDEATGREVAGEYPIVLAGAYRGAQTGEADQRVLTMDGVTSQPCSTFELVDGDGELDGPDDPEEGA